MKEVGLAEKYADVLTTQEINGSRLARLTKEKLERCRLPVGPEDELLTAAARLWTCTAIHGVVLAPADDNNESENDSVGGTGKILTVRGRDARDNLGGLSQIFRYLTE